MQILFFDSKGVIHLKYVPEGQTVSTTFYVQVLDYLCERIAQRDNACLHTAAII